MKNKKGLIIALIVMLVFAVAIIIYNVKNRFEYNENGATGNTAGNLYNEGLFCEYGGYVYFSNQSDNGALYRMNMDGNEFEKLYDDNTSYINIHNDNIYYRKFNSEQNKDALFQRMLYGISRLKTDGGAADVIHSGMVDCITLCGNYVYYRYYDNDRLFSLRKVKIDGTEDELISDEDYQPICVYNEKIYFKNESGNHDLMVLDTADDTIRTVASGNFYMPDAYNGELYFIDLANDRRLTKMSLSSMEKTVLSEDKVINYNMSGKYGVIYYQAENTVDDHRLCRINTDGSEAVTISAGDYNRIGITKKYTYFCKEIGEETIMYRTPTTGGALVETFNPEVITD